MLCELFENRQTVYYHRDLSKTSKVVLYIHAQCIYLSIITHFIRTLLVTIIDIQYAYIFCGSPPFVVDLIE